MPYIEQDRRSELQEGNEPLTPGELSYAITRLLLAYVGTLGTKYQTYNDVLGALEGAKLEFYRRRVAPYEDWKAHVNGDVY